MAKPTYTTVKAALDSGKTLQQLAKTYKRSYNSMRAWWAAQNSKHVKEKRFCCDDNRPVSVLPFTPENFSKVLDRYEESAKPAATPASDDALEWTRLVWQGMLVDAQMLQPGHTLTRQRVRMLLEAAEKAKEGKA